MKGCSLYIAAVLFSCSARAQTITFREAGKWGIMDGAEVVIPARYDTAFNFDKGKNVCMVCNKTTAPSSNRFIRQNGAVMRCFYLNSKGERLILKTESFDTIGTFSLLKTSVRQFQEDSAFILVAHADQRFLVRKDFTQITRRAYSEVTVSPEPSLIIVYRRNEAGQELAGLVTMQEREIVPVNYSSIKLNTRDSLIIACSAGLGRNREDDVYDYSGKKLGSYRRHVDMATRSHVIHKIWEPKEYYIIHNKASGEDRQVFAEEIRLFDQEQLLMRNDEHWFTYDLATGKKKAYEQKKRH